MRRHPVRHVACMALLQLFATTPAARAETRLTFDELRAAVSAQMTSLRSIYIDYTLTKPESQGGKTSEHVWAQQDKHVVLRTRYTDAAIGVWTGFDGSKSYFLGYDNDRRPAALEIKDGAPNLYVGVKISKLMGVQIASGGGTIADATAAPSAALRESPDEHIYVVHVDDFVSKPTPTVLTLTLEIDAMHDYFARRIDYVATNNPAWKFTYVVDRFDRITDQSDGSPRWFPVAGRYIQETPETGVEEFRFAVTEAKINEVLPESVFIPTLPDNVSVTDNTEKGRGSYYITGGYNSKDERLNDLANDAMQQVSNQNRTRLMLTCITIIVLGATGLFFWRSKRAASTRKPD